MDFGTSADVCAAIKVLRIFVGFVEGEELMTMVSRRLR
jgi:hypothetical protein